MSEVIKAAGEVAEGFRAKLDSALEGMQPSIAVAERGFFAALGKPLRTSLLSANGESGEWDAQVGHSVYSQIAKALPPLGQLSEQLVGLGKTIETGLAPFKQQFSRIAELNAEFGKALPHLAALPGLMQGLELPAGLNRARLMRLCREHGERLSPRQAQHAEELVRALNSYSVTRNRHKLSRYLAIAQSFLELSKSKKLARALMRAFADLHGGERSLPQVANRFEHAAIAARIASPDPPPPRPIFAIPEIQPNAPASA